MFARGGAGAEVSDRAWLRAMLDVEAALARACATEGVVPTAAAEAITRACAAGRFDLGALGREGAQGGNPVIPLVGALRDAVGADAAPHVHRGATSQDVLDSAASLVARRALRPILDDAGDAATAAAALAEAHRETPTLGRTLLQPGRPTTFGLKAAGWMTQIDEARELVVTARTRLAVQLGGPVGTLAALEGRGPAVARRLAAALDLAEPTLPWHTARVRPTALAGALGILVGALGKVGRDVTLLAQGEVGEVRERARGGSSSMAHKHNPVAAVATVACATRTPALVSTLLAAMVQEHERAAGAWHAEWETWSDLLRLSGSAAAWAGRCLGDLEVFDERMGATLAAAIAEHGLDRDRGAAAELVDRALGAHRGP